MTGNQAEVTEMIVALTLLKATGHTTGGTKTVGKRVIPLALTSDIVNFDKASAKYCTAFALNRAEYADDLTALDPRLLLQVNCVKTIQEQMQDSKYLMLVDCTSLDVAQVDRIVSNLYRYLFEFSDSSVLLMGPEELIMNETLLEEYEDLYKMSTTDNRISFQSIDFPDRVPGLNYDIKQMFDHNNLIYPGLLEDAFSEI